MSQFADSNFDSKLYDLYRPTYPPKFISYIIEKCIPIDKENVRIVDIGTGPGTALSTLIDLIEEKTKNGQLKVKKYEIWATDVSEVMIEQAKQKLSKYNSELIQINFAVCQGEEIDSIVEGVDLVLAAECAHWLNVDKWIACMRKVCHGYLVYWGYVDGVFIDYPELNQFYDDFVYDEGELGKCWNQPGRNILRSCFKDTNERMKKEFECEIVYRNPATGVGEGSPLRITQNVTVEDYLKYVDTWSASFSWNASHKPEERAGLLFDKGFQKYGLNHNDKLNIEMKTVYCIAKIN